MLNDIINQSINPRFLDFPPSLDDGIVCNPLDIDGTFTKHPLLIRTLREGFAIAQVCKEFSDIALPIIYCTVDLSDHDRPLAFDQ